MMSDQNFDKATAEAMKVIRDLSPQGYCVAVNISRPDVDFLQMHYEMPWLQYYAENNLLLDDPTVSFAHSTNGHITWDDLREMYPEARTLKDCRKFGIDKGNTLVIEIDGVKSLVSGAGKNWTTSEIQNIRFALHTIHLMNVTDRALAS